VKANFKLEESNDKYVLIRDLCSDSNPGMTLTNDAESVVEYLFDKNLLGNQTRLFYIDTNGRVDELLHLYRKFDGFKFGYESEQDFYDNFKI